MAANITFKEGTAHSVVINLPVEIDLTVYDAKIQVRQAAGDEVVFEFSTQADTLTDGINSLLLEIPATLSVGKAGSYKWQLMLNNTTDLEDIIKFPIYGFTVLQAITF